MVMTSDYSLPLLTEFALVSADIKQTLWDSARITPEQFQVLARLEAAEEPATPSFIARMLSLPPSSVATVFKRLWSIGAVSVWKAPYDGRSQLIELSDIGRALLSAADKSLSTLFERVWQPLSQEQLTFTHWGSARAMSGHNLIRVSNGSVDVDAAYCESILMSMRLCKASLAGHGLGMNEYRVMKAVGNAADSGLQLRAGEVGVILVMSSSLVAQTLSTLEGRCMLTRTPSPDDCRVRLIHLTDEGTSVLVDARRDILRAMRRSITPMSRASVDEYGRIAEQIVDMYRKSVDLS